MKSKYFIEVMTYMEARDAYLEKRDEPIIFHTDDFYTAMEQYRKEIDAVSDPLTTVTLYLSKKDEDVELAEYSTLCPEKPIYIG